MRWLLVVLVCASLLGCKKSGQDAQDSNGGGGGGADPSKSLGTLNAKQDLNFEYDHSFGSHPGATWTLSNNPSWLQVDSATGKLSGVPESAVTHQNIVLTGKGPDFDVSAKFDVSVVGDPLVGFQWALKNTGQTSFAQNGGVAGEDMRVKEAHRTGALGEGVVIMVSDEGVQLSHDDFSGGIYENKSKNYFLPPPYFGSPDKGNTTQGNHGTAVTGIAAARGWNMKGTRGVAPLSKVAGTNFIDQNPVDDLMTIDQASNGTNAFYDVFNYSYGVRNGALIDIPDSYQNQLIYGTAKQRSGKGSVYVKSAGNSYLKTLVGFSGMTPVYLNRPLSANHEEENAVPWVFVVGAINAKGKRSSYSSTGSNLLVSAPGGEYGDTDPAIVTTDEMDCSHGYSPTYGAANSFEAGNAPNVGCNYTSIMNGTSSAAPHTSGAVAVIMSARPSLTWRDIRHILITTAQKVDPTQADVTATVGGVSFVAQDGWSNNGAGLPYSPWYGFGRIDLKAAVDLAKTLTPLAALKQTVTKSNNCPQTEFCADDAWQFNSATLNFVITDNNATGVSNTLNVTTNLKIEAIQVRVTINTARNGDIGIRLTSPAGTAVNVLDPRSGLVDTNFVNQTFLVNKFYGESSSGNWTIKVFDVQTSPVSMAGNTNGTFVRWSINVIGRDP